MESRSTKIVDGGKLVIPASFRRELGVQVGDTVVMEMVDGELRVRSRNAAIDEIQKIVRGLVPEGVSVVDEFLADRRAEAAKE
ncbi:MULTISPECIES: AbrB/MazE/SpoVT family DNA-binding domain-containing protein [Methylobacteriaceae]|uniref:AbrB/MazE/SpoVT family DNA-binding domain-containing protein n=1 Tax=Methylobacteriaceae TaxID=119045 RepID=UPI00074F9469|nr:MULTISPECIES: AbrB/MazE/SpoVT family DNA-binding domain-containing protein [Methylobacteriaceae]AMB44371.1 AbrB family transcriptional regulator [Methylobacterium sp. AMS5]TFZ55382.1 AbrB/MazE/SpoVT family DNA-binding domain-containing protein [Methylorubrum sp. Q1]